MLYGKLTDTYQAQRYEWLLRMARTSYSERMRAVETLEGDIQTQLDLIAKLKKVEDRYLTKLGFLGPKSDAFRTLPGFSAANRLAAPAKLGTLDYTENTKTGKQSLVAVGDQDVNIGYGELLKQLKNEDSFLRRINYKILCSRLKANQMLEQLRKLKEERTAVRKDNETTETGR